MQEQCFAFEAKKLEKLRVIDAEGNSFDNEFD